MTGISKLLQSKAAGAVVGTAFGAAYLDAAHDILNDLRKVRDIRSIQSIMQKHTLEDRRSLYHFFQDAVEKWPNNEMLVYEDEIITYAQADKIVNRISHWLWSQGLRRGDYISLDLPNTPSFALWWFGCLQIGLLPSFLNFNQNGKVLKHSITTTKPSMVVYDIEFEENLATISDELKAEGYKIVRWVDHYTLPGASIQRQIVDIHELHIDHLATVSDERMDPNILKDVSWDTAAAFIFTSGTTGLPKAAHCSHAKFTKGSLFWKNSLRLRSDDRILSVLPMYHSTGTILLISPLLMTGCALIIVRKFSASRFFDEARKYRATTAHYIGELPRYVLSTPPRADDKEHTLRLVSGNGMRPEVWTAFKERFGINEVHEFFGATEGNGSLINDNYGPYGDGAIGKRGSLIKFLTRNDNVLIKINPDTEEPVRDSNGLCVKVADGEPGELLTRIDRTLPISGYLGYHNADSATNKKILRNVVKKGDEYYRFGDLIKSEGPFYYFMDRIGDTFRWRAENVSTTEVQGVLDAVVEEANVYGVQLPAHDGRCGCFAVPAHQWEKVDTKKVAEYVIKNLPIYARPIFVRIVEETEMTGTNKLQKVKLRNEGVDPNKVRDPIFWLKDSDYVPFTPKDWDSVVGGKVKL